MAEKSGLGRSVASLTERQTLAILDRLEAEGFRSGFDCAAFCMDGHYSQRSKRWGEPKSERWCVSLTPIGEMRDRACRALGEGFASAGRSADSTYWIFEWKDEWDA